MTDAPGTPDDGPGRLSPLAAMRRHWKASAGLIALGLIAGVAYGAGQSPTYDAMARVGVGSGTTGQNEVGFIEVALEQVADNDARIVTTNNFVPKLPASVGNPSGVSSITATTIPNSAIIEIDVAASDASTALKTAAYVEQQFIAQVNATANYATPATVLAQLTPLTAQQVTATNALTEAQAALATLKATPGTSAAAISAQQAVVNADQTKVTLLNTQVNALDAQYSSLLSNPQPASTLHQITSAVSAGSNKTSLIERYGLVGLAVGALIALGAAVTRDSRRVQRERAALAAAAPLAAVSDIRSDEAGVEGAAVAESVRAEVRRNRTRGGRPETAASPWGPDADDPYLTQARRTALDAQRREARARLDAEAEAHRREVRDVLQRMARAAEATKAASETGLFYPPAPESHDEPVPGGDPEPAPESAPQSAPEAESAPAAEPVSAGDVAAKAELVDEAPAPETPAVDVPAVDAPAAEAPAVEALAPEVPAVEVPAQGVSDGAERPMADVRPLFGPRAGSRRIRVLPDSDESDDDFARELGEGRASGLPDGALPEDEPFPIFDNADDDGSYDDAAHAGVHDGEPSGERPSSDDGWRGSGH